MTRLRIGCQANFSLEKEVDTLIRQKDHQVLPVWLSSNPDCLTIQAWLVGNS